MGSGDRRPQQTRLGLMAVPVGILPETDMAEPYDTWLEADEAVALPNALAFKVVLQLGSRTFDLSDAVRIAYSTDPTMTTGVSYTAPSIIATGDQSGTWKNVSVPGLSANTRYYYRAQFSDDGSTYPIEGEIRTVSTQPAATSPVMITFGADRHWIIKRAKRASSSHLQAALDVDQLVCANIAAERDKNGNPASLHISPGDSAMYAVANQIIYALKTDGSGDSDPGADSMTVKTATDCNEIIRAMRINSDFPHHSLPYMEARSNHWPAHWFHYNANEGSNPDVAAWANAAMQNGLGIPAGALGIYRGAETYGAFNWGPLLVCMVDPYLDSYPTVTTPAPTTMDSLDDWVLSDTQRDFSFHATTGELAITTKPWVVIVCHHLIGGRGAGGAIEFYGRGGINYVKEAGTYWADTVHPALVSLKAANSNIKGIIVAMGHDHVHQFAALDGINYCHLAVPGDAPGGAEGSVYGTGFSGSGTGNYLGNRMPNAGHYRLDADPANFVLSYTRAYLADTGEPDPSDGIIINRRSVQALVLPDQMPRIGPPWAGKKRERR